ncbi:MmgE/PrpD family protein [Marinivivus vitaminiproducens]|uniref:MmgE/PrpD family protein n=1 Tax=Marinivivus vitaminiproducens TaxID=3035935 RepID=UPI002798F06C|nr:MmgE/PrpD family protein [Geminicoccaceae bacterium SCSIO 64248]
MAGLTRSCAAFVSDVTFGALPDTCREAARVGMLDCVGVMIAGASEEPVQLIAATVPTSASNEGAPEIPSGRNLSPGDAALVNGVAAHVLDYDDVAMDGHTSAVLTPAILAEGWMLDSSGEDAIAAYVAGYELWALLEELEPGHLHDRGFHPTAAWGSLATAAACARLHGLTSEQTVHAIAIAASLASGLVANFGTMTKSLHAGRAAQSGVLAARLAKSGFTGSPDALEHPTGFMRAHSPSGAPELTKEDWRLGETWRLVERGINVKRYPICYATHRSIDAMLDLVSEHKLTPDAVESIQVHTGTTQALMLRNHEPKTGLEAKFSMEFAMASALVAGRVGLNELTDGFVGRPDMIATMRKVQTATTDATMDGMPFAPSDQVTVTLADGRTLEHAPVSHAKGSWQRPMDRAELLDKFADCAGRRMQPDQVEALFEALWNIGSLTSIRELPLTAMN